MAESPWQGKITPGLFAQKLEQLGCSKVGIVNPGNESWQHPDGPVFTVSLEDCDDKQLEAIAEQIEIWVNEKNRKKR